MLSESCRWYFKPQPDSVALARSAVAEFAVMCGFYRSVAEDIRLAVGEACNNAVEHGQPASDIVVACEYSDDALTVHIEDNGRGFQVAATAPNRESMPTRGLGIFLMRRLMDRVNFRQKPGDGTEVMLEKRKVRARELV